MEANMNLTDTFINESTGDKLKFEEIDCENYLLTWTSKDGTVYGPEEIHLSAGGDSYHITGGKILDNQIIKIGRNTIIINNSIIYKRLIE